MRHCRLMVRCAVLAVAVVLNVAMIPGGAAGTAMAQEAVPRTSGADVRAHAAANANVVAVPLRERGPAPAGAPAGAPLPEDQAADSLPVVPFILESVAVTTADLYEGVERTWLVSDFLEFFHVVTRERAIRNEFFVQPGDTVRQLDLDEVERNLRELGIFAVVRFEVQPLPDQDEEEIPRARLIVHTRDVLSIRGGASYTQSQDARSLYAGLREFNLFGTAKQFGAAVRYTTLNDLGWSYELSYLNPNVLATHSQITAEVALSARRNLGSLAFGRPFFSDRTRDAFNISTSLFDGDAIFDMHSPAGAVISPEDDLSQTDVSAWYSHASNTRGNVFFTSVRVAYNRTIHRVLSGVERAFENTAGVFVGIGSRRRTYTKIVDADFNGLTQVPIGGMGSVSIGKLSPHNGGLDNVVYIGADARQAWRDGDLYGFASVYGGTGLAGKESRFTTERVVASGLWLVHPGAVAARFEQSTVWNWPRYLNLPLDNANYLRGTTRLESFGDNRMMFNLEYRLNPVLNLVLFDVGAAAFFDIGATWEQSRKLADAQFRSGAGIGLRVGNAAASINKGFLRIDLAYNFQERRFARLIISTTEAFDVFGTLDFRPPGPYVY